MTRPTCARTSLGRPAHVRMARRCAATPAAGSGRSAGTRPIAGAGMSGRARRPPVHTRDGGVVVVVMIAPLKSRILYKRERELDRQTIPLQGVGGWSMWDQPLIIGE